MSKKDKLLPIAKVKILARKISFLMSHQVVLPDLEELIEELKLSSPENVNNSEYLLGAYHAFSFLINDLKDKS